MMVCYTRADDIAGETVEDVEDVLG